MLRICLGNSSSHRIISLPACHNYNGLENAGNLNYEHNVDLLIGAACDEETETVSRLALRWHKIYFSSAILSTKEKESTTIALRAHSLTGTAEMIEAVCKAMQWLQIGIIYSEETKYSAHSIYDLLSASSSLKIGVFLQTDGLTNSYTILNSARVLFSFASLQNLTIFIETLKNEAFRPLEYSLIHVDFENRTTPSEFYKFLDLAASTDPNSISAARLRKLHRHVALIRNLHGSIDNMRYFAARHNLEMNSSLFNALILCDGLQLLKGFGRFKNRTMLQELPRLWHHITNTESHGYSGPMFIGSDGIRLPYFEIFLTRDNTTIHVAAIKPRDSTLCEPNRLHCYELIRTIHGNLLDDLPPFISECGFDNSLCSDSHVFIIAGVVFGILLIPLAIAFYLQRKEQLIQQMPWRVPFDLVSFGDDPQKSSSASRRISFSSSTRISCSSIFGAVSCEHAFVNRQKVTIKRIIQRKAITFSRKEMEFLNQLKYTSHNNVNQFRGICFNQGSEMLVMWHFAPRYSLENLIFIKEQKFGRNFQSTFIKHILNGIQYIHNSAIKVHGALYLSNCVVDSHWVVKLTDFGIRRVLIDKIHHKELVNLADMEPLHYKYIQQAPEHLSYLMENNEEPLGSVEGDIYQIAMVIYQILFYMRPFAERSEDISELAKAIVSPSSSSVHPKVPEETNFTMRLLSIIQQCWLYKPAARPTLYKINDAVSREFAQDVKGPLIDQMIEMIDEYSANLEQIVSERTRELEAEMAKTENLLYQLLPKQIADSIRSGNSVSPEQHASVSLLVVDICQFTKFCEAFIPVNILETLQELYSSFDYIVQKNRAFKVENVGDAYLICSGIPEMKSILHLREICKIALMLQKFMSSFTVRHRPDHKLEIKLGICSGAVASGILGSIAPRFCLFGDTVNMACRMASTSLPGMIQLSELTGNVLKEKFPAFILEERGMVDVKGKGPCLTYWLKGDRNIKRDCSRASNILK